MVFILGEFDGTQNTLYCMLVDFLGVGYILDIVHSMQEELEEEGHSVIYDDFKFVTKEDLEKLNLGNLIGTNLLRAYMHGFFIDHRLYNKVKDCLQICECMFSPCNCLVF
jgi:hypothetical protein